MNERIYLAGPDVFRPDAEEYFASVKALLLEAGFVGLSPLDCELTLTGDPCRAHAHTIYSENVKLIASCDAVLANLSPFRGPSADVGTVFEVGYAIARGIMVVGYSTNHQLYTDRVVAQFPFDDDNIKPFGLRDNLMIEGSLMHQRSPVRLLDTFSEAASVIAQLFA